MRSGRGENVRPSFLTRGAALAALALVLASVPPACAAQEQSFESWLAGVRAEALAHGITPATVDTALAGVAPIPRILELDRRQPEFTLTFEQYLGRAVSDARVQKGIQLLADNQTLLDRIGQKYGVQPRFIVALWGVETDFGRIGGGFPVIAALATLSYDSRRPQRFRPELIDALAIIDQGHVTAAEMKGSWAGAMGQNQFMPSSFRRYAVDYDGDGRRDIWSTKADVFASTANYLSQVGWRGDQTWGRMVRLPSGLDARLVGLESAKRLSEWQALGVRQSDGRDLPDRDLSAALLRLGGDDGPAVLVYDNFRALLRWNPAHLFATAVGHLADRIAAR